MWIRFESVRTFTPNRNVRNKSGWPNYRPVGLFFFLNSFFSICGGALLRKIKKLTLCHTLLVQRVWGNTYILKWPNLSPHKFWEILSTIFYIYIYIYIYIYTFATLWRGEACKESSDETESIAIIFSAEINLLWRLNWVWVSIKLYYIYIYIYIYLAFFF